jgi:thiosulfate sulfurtransferase
MSISIVSQSEAMDLLAQGAQLIDIRDQEAFAAGHIEGAKNIGDHNREAFIADSDLDKPLVICCYAGKMSQNAANFFSERGFEKVYSIDGGFNGWES